MYHRGLVSNYLTSAVLLVVFTNKFLIDLTFSRGIRGAQGEQLKNIGMTRWDR